MDPNLADGRGARGGGGGMDRTDELLSRMTALEAELARLRAALPEASLAVATDPVVPHPPAPGRRAALRRLALGAGAAVGLLAAAREPRPAHALFEGQHVSTANDPNFGIAAYPSGVATSQAPAGVVAAVFGLIGPVSTLTTVGSSGVLGLGGGFRIGVQGVSASNAGVLGISRSYVGVQGASNESHAFYGQTSSATFSAVRGVNAAPSGLTIGVQGDCSSPNGTGVYGSSVSNAGVRGHASGGMGVLGTSVAGTGVHGTSEGNFTQGVLGEGTGGNAHGVTGASVNAFGLSGTSTNSNGFVGVNTNGNNFAGLFIGHAANLNNFTAPGIYVKGRAVITGGISASAVTSQGPRLLHGIQAADDLAEDVGTATLRAGRARVELDPLFAETIRTDAYRIFLTPYGDSRGLFVAAKDGRGFTVQEAQGGTGSYGFDWRVVAERKEAPAGSRLMRHEGVDVRRVLEQLPQRGGAEPERRTAEPALPAAPPSPSPSRPDPAAPPTPPAGPGPSPGRR